MGGEGGEGGSRKKSPGSHFVSLSHTCPLSSPQLSTSVFSILTRLDISQVGAGI